MAGGGGGVRPLRKRAQEPSVPLWEAQLFPNPARPQVSPGNVRLHLPT